MTRSLYLSLSLFGFFLVVIGFQSCHDDEGYYYKNPVVETPYEPENEDSLAIVNADWKIDNSRNGLTAKEAQFKLFGRSQSICCLEIDPGIYSPGISIKNGGGLAVTSYLCKQVDAVAGINGAYYVSTGAASKDYLRIDGEVCIKGRDNYDPGIVNAAFIFSNSQNLQIRNVTGNHEARDLPGRNILVAGPMLVNDGSVCKIENTDASKYVHPRSAIGLTKKGKLLMVTVDGRRPGEAVGMTNHELAFLMRILGAKEAMGLDGGRSTTLYLKGYGDTSIVNVPGADERKERSVGSVIYVK